MSSARRARFQRLDHRRRLRGRTGRVLGREMARVVAARQVVDERVHVDARHGPAVLGPDLHRRPVRDHEVAPVAGHVVPHPGFQGPQQRRLAVEAAADDERHSGPDPHAPHRARVRQRELDRHRLGGRERHARLQRPVVDARAPRQHRPVRDEPDQARGRDRLTERRYVIGVPDPPLGLLLAHRQRFIGRVGEHLAQQARGLAPRDPPAVARQLRAEAERHGPVLADFAGGPPQDLLPAGVDPQVPGRTRGPQSLREQDRDGAPPLRTRVPLFVQVSGFGVETERHSARRRVRVRLDLGNVQNRRSCPPFATQGFISAVTRTFQGR